jgi:hypothetical protein
MRLRAPALAASLLLPACHNGAGQATPERSCEAVTDTLPLSVSAESLAGEYRLRLVARGAEGAGASAVGKLSLVLQDPDAQRRPGPFGVTDTIHRYPLVGAAELDFAAVGAVTPGGTASLDPAAPGVLAIERPGAAAGATDRLILRLGTEANRIERVRFDGGYTVLRLRRADSRGIAGDWESGAPLPRTSGYFCADRIGPS